MLQNPGVGFLLLCCCSSYITQTESYIVVPSRQNFSLIFTEVPCVSGDTELTRMSKINCTVLNNLYRFFLLNPDEAVRETQRLNALQQQHYAYKSANSAAIFVLGVTFLMIGVLACCRLCSLFMDRGQEDSSRRGSQFTSAATAGWGAELMAFPTPRYVHPLWSNYSGAPPVMIGESGRTAEIVSNSNNNNDSPPAYPTVATISSAGNDLPTYDSLRLPVTSSDGNKDDVVGRGCVV